MNYLKNDPVIFLLALAVVAVTVIASIALLVVSA